MTPMRARASIPPELLNMLRNLVEAESGVVLNDAKLSHLASFVLGRMEKLGIDDGPDYLAFLSEGDGGAEQRR